MKNIPRYQLFNRLYLTHDSAPFVTPERIELLRCIDKSGSISAGAKAMAKSYKWAWDSIEEMNRFSSVVLVRKASGGKGGGGAHVTPFALELMDYYEELVCIYQSKIMTYQERFKQAFVEKSFRKNMASTLHARVESVSCHGDTCELVLRYGSAKLKAKAQSGFLLSVGDEVTFMLESNQVIIAKEAVAISAQNLLVGVISEIDEEDQNVYLKLRLETEEILSVLITQDALEQFNLSVGERCFAYFKTHTITILGDKSA